MSKRTGLGKWFREDWVDVSTGKPCGRKSARKSKRGYPACRPKAQAAKMTAAEKKRFTAKKRAKGKPSGKRPRSISWKGSKSRKS